MDAAISPQTLDVGESIQKNQQTTPNVKPKTSYAAQITKQKSAAIPKIELRLVIMVHGEPIVEFSVDKVNSFTIEEGLHQAVILKFSYGKPYIQDLRHIIPKQFDVKGYCNIGQLEYRHILVSLIFLKISFKFIQGPQVLLSRRVMSSSLELFNGQWDLIQKKKHHEQ